MSTDPWCDLAAEDGVTFDQNGEIDGVIHGLTVDLPELREMPGPLVNGIRRMPGPNTVIKRNALDAIRAIFQGHPVRVLVLHTCTVGDDVEFTQALSNRMQVYLRAQVPAVEYERAPPGRIHATYDGEAPTP